MCKSFLAAVSQIVVGIFSFSVVAEAAFPIQSPLLYIPRARFCFSRTEVSVHGTLHTYLIFRITLSISIEECHSGSFQYLHFVVHRVSTVFELSPMNHLYHTR